MKTETISDFSRIVFGWKKYKIAFAGGSHLSPDKKYLPVWMKLNSQSLIRNDVESDGSNDFEERFNYLGKNTFGRKYSSKGRQLMSDGNR